MGYLEDFKNQINNRDFHKFFQLWEEYCTSDQTDCKEFMQLLNMIKESDFAQMFGQFIETALPLWRNIQDANESYKILARLIDLETTNTPFLAETAYQALEERYGSEPEFKERIRRIGLRSRESFQGALSNYEILRHLKKGNFVYHAGGWGTGEVVDVSTIREQAAIEFENVSGIKHLSFDNAFKTLVPLEMTHFLARRFSNADRLEMEAKKDPVEVLKCLLRDIGPKTASEIKDELCVLVINEADWSKWWQSARGKLKKDTMVHTPASLREPFYLREIEISHADQFSLSLKNENDVNTIVQKAYAFARDMPDAFKKEVKDSLKQKLLDILKEEKLLPEQELQIILFLESTFGHQIQDKKIHDFIQSMDNIEKVINDIDIIGFKKQALVMVRGHRSDWPSIFADFLFTMQTNPLKDYLLKELSCPETKKLLDEKLDLLLHHPERYPEAYFWYFQKLAKKNPEKVPYSDKEGQCKFLEGLLILLHKIEHESEYRDLTKKIYAFLTAKRFAVIRLLIEGSSIEFVKEFLLLVSKCHTFPDHEKKIMLSLASVVHPSLAPKKKKKGFLEDPNILWSTEESYQRIQERIKHIATVEMIENAKEVEAARALGDLRENSEYKSACEKRARLQGEIKTLSKELQHARILTPDDILADEVCVGSIVELESSQGDRITYKVLGPWDADADRNIISYQSQFALAMAGAKVGDSFSFREENYKILGIKSFLT